MADFQRALNKILKWEGGWSDNKHDHGGATNKGITLRTYQSYYGVGKTKADLANISKEEVEHIYRVGYWDKIKGDLIRNQSLAELVFDFVVNSGVGKIKDMQGITDCVADGIVGPQTLAAWNSLPKKCFDAIWQYRERFYNKIGVGDQERFKKGWLRRLNDYRYEG